MINNDNDDNNNKDNDTGIVISIIMNPSGMARPCIKTVIYCHYYQIHILQNIEFLWKKCIDKIGIMPYYMNTRDTCTSTTGKTKGSFIGQIGAGFSESLTRLSDELFFKTINDTGIVKLASGSTGI